MCCNLFVLFSFACSNYFTNLNRRQQKIELFVHFYEPLVQFKAQTIDIQALKNRLPFLRDGSTGSDSVAFDRDLAKIIWEMAFEARSHAQNILHLTGPPTRRKPIRPMDKPVPAGDTPRQLRRLYLALDTLPRLR